MEGKNSAFGYSGSRTADSRLTRRYRHIFAWLVGLTLALLPAEAPGGVVQPPGIWTHPPYPSGEFASTGPIISARVDPVSIVLGRETFRVMIGVDAPGTASVRMVNVPEYLRRSGLPIEDLDLHDDGTTGDEIPGDNVYTADALSIHFAFGSNLLNIAWWRDQAFVLVQSGGGSIDVSQDLGLTLGYITEAVPIPDVTPLAADAQRTDHVFNVTLQRTGVFPDFSFMFEAATTRFYDFLPDDRDFLLLASTFNAATQNAGTFGAMRNNVSGIGLRTFDISSYYGSDGVLQGLVDTHYAQHTEFALLNHEYLHRWCAFLSPELDLARRSHWGAIERPSSGFIKGSYSGVFSSLEPLDQGRYLGRIGSLDWRMNDLELYLMGLVDSGGIASPIRTLVNPVLVDETPEGSYYETDGLREVGIGEILAVEGPRFPGPDHSQKSFTSGMIVVSDRLLTPSELAFFDFPMREYERETSDFSTLTFFEATHSLARMYTNFSGVGVPECSIRPLTVDVGQVEIGHTAIGSFAITNRSNGWLSGALIEECDDWEVSPREYSIPPGDSLELTLTFTATTGGRQECAIACDPCGVVVAQADVPPILVAPPDGAIAVSLPLTLRWSEEPPRGVKTANSYMLLVGLTPDLFPPIVEEYVRGLEYTTVPGELELATRYYWQVCLEGHQGYWACSPIWSFESSPSPVTVSALEATSTGWGIRIRWQSAIDDHLLGFQVERARTQAGPGEGQHEPVGPVMTSPPYEVLDETAIPGQEYSYTVWALDRRGSRTAFGPVLARLTPTLALSAPEPNPFARTTVLRLLAPDTEETLVQVLSAGGAHVRTLSRGVLPAGIHRLVWDGTNQGGTLVGAGVYFLRVETGHHSVVRKVIVLR